MRRLSFVCILSVCLLAFDSSSALLRRRFRLFALKGKTNERARAPPVHIAYFVRRQTSAA
jgi:hypothetical protein